MKLIIAFFVFTATAFAQLDPQVIGWQDDGTEQGLIRTAPVKSGLVSVPFFGISASQSGTTTVNLNADIGGLTESGSSSIYISVPANPTNYASIDWKFSGKALGLLVYCANGVCDPLTNSTVFIDGVAYPLKKIQATWKGVSSISWANGELRIIISDNLPDGPHQASWQTVGTSQGAQVFNLINYLVEERVGYKPQPLSSVYCNGYLLGTTNATALNTILSGAPNIIRFVSKITLSNIGTNNAVVTSSVWGKTALIAPISSTNTFEWTFIPPLALNQSQMTFKSSSPSNITVAVFGIK